MLAGAGVCFAEVITVNWDGTADYTTLQEAINAAVHDDTVIVSEGTYVENINIGGKNITLTSTNPDDPNVVEAPVIDGGGMGSVVKFAGSEDARCKLVGFTVTNGIGTIPEGSGIRFGSGTVVMYESFKKNVAGLHISCGW